MMTRKIYAEWWWCGDEECDCHQPRMVMRSDEHFHNPAWKPPISVSVGPFYSAPEPDDWKEMIEWMKDACEKRGLEVPDPPYCPAIEGE